MHRSRLRQHYRVSRRRTACPQHASSRTPFDRDTSSCDLHWHSHVDRSRISLTAVSVHGRKRLLQLESI
jgi:hypothetical protein